MRPRVAVIGTRGIPDVHGGVEYHCEELYPRLAELGFDITVYARRPYVPEEGEYRGVRVVPLKSIHGKSSEAITHSAYAAWTAGRERFDICHFHSIGPAATIPIARMAGARRVVFTMHGPDYEQQKWGANARRFLRFGERIGATKADVAISVSRHLQQRLQDSYGRDVLYVPNGPRAIRHFPPGQLLESLGLAHGGYLLYVGRLVPDKRVEDLILAAARLSSAVPVVIAGHSSHAWEYGAHLKEISGANVHFTGWVDWPHTQELFSSAAVFVLPSGVEGLPLSLLEAMAHGIPCVASDIAANLEVLGDPPAGLVYPLGDVDALVSALMKILGDGRERDEIVAAGRTRIAEKYDWDRVALRTAEIYRSLLA